MIRYVLGFLFIALAISPLAARTHDLEVPASYATIQSAIDAAPPGATVRVSPGTYRENLRIEKALTLVSTDGAETTILDGDAKGVVVWVFGAGDGSEAVRISGFTITNGLNLFEGGSGTGSGIRAENVIATITDNTITRNVGCYGVGIFTQVMSVTIRRNRIRQNVQHTSCGGSNGGGIYMNGGGSAPSDISHNVIAGHRIGGYGGGVGINAVENLRIASNTFRNNHASDYGGGLYTSSSDADVVDNTFDGNSATGYGGGMSLAADVPTNKIRVRDNTFRNNTAAYEGSAAALSSFYDHSIRFDKNGVIGHSAGSLVHCGVLTIAIPKSNTLVNSRGPTLGGSCIEGRHD